MEKPQSPDSPVWRTSAEVTRQPSDAMAAQIIEYMTSADQHTAKQQAIYNQLQHIWSKAERGGGQPSVRILDLFRQQLEDTFAAADAASAQPIEVCFVETPEKNVEKFKQMFQEFGEIEQPGKSQKYYINPDDYQGEAAAGDVAVARALLKTSSLADIDKLINPDLIKVVAGLPHHREIVEEWEIEAKYKVCVWLIALLPTETMREYREPPLFT